MHLLALIVGIGLLNQAYTMKCYECEPGLFTSCTRTEIECPSPNHQCISWRTVSYARQLKLPEFTGESCALPEQCNIGGSISLGSFKILFTNSCCTTDLCNNKPPPPISEPLPNGKKCYYCSILRQTCSASLDCLGEEDYCFTSTTSQGTTVKGCASKAVCSGSQSITDKVGSELTCCQGDYCNDASITSPIAADPINKANVPNTKGASGSAVQQRGGVLLLIPLLYFIVFS